MKKHFTATAYIISKIDNQYKVLLHRHKKHGVWIGIGGHVEGNENPVEALVREVKEETNLEIELLNKDKLLKINDVEELVRPDAILQERLSAYKNEPSHYHIDLIYFVVCQNPKDLKMKEKYSWFSKKDLKKKGLEKEVFYLSLKLFRILKNV